MRIAYLFILSLSFSSCSQTPKIPSKITYDFSCMEEDGISSLINLGSDIEKEMVRNYGKTVSVNLEKAYGDSTFSELKKTSKISQKGESYSRILNVLNRITPNIKAPKGYSYSIYLIESSELNAFTVGGKIFFTSAMISFCNSDNEIACIIGHEIAHNELGHVKDGISRIETANEYGAGGNLSSSIGNLITTSFNQKNETHADFVGVDLAIASGYNGCSSSKLWNRMKKQENSQDGFETFFRSHPYSSKREVCIKNHIESNYSIECN
jgi:predicted Zn-dependent protease